MTRAAAFAVALLAAGCASGSGAAAPIEAGPVAASLRIECDRARIVVPERLRARLVDRQKCPDPPFLVSVDGIDVVVREVLPEVEVAGEDLSIVAEGGVRLTRPMGTITVEEGPFRVVLYRNGEILRR